ncbi:MAG TPA: M20/M25/M40 family metallo-hydrolase [Polyangia bacterium]|jgi:Tol biopolymer transport system component/Zn-dependent M28 family amino/carboxypeptidase
MRRAILCAFLAATASAAWAQAPAAATPPPKPDEPHLADIRQLTFGGENAEAYWSWSGQQLILQSRPGAGCDRIYRMDWMDPKAPMHPVSNGKGATTCSYFFPGDQEVLYASTQLASPECPPRPDHSKGYVWALYDGYDIFRAHADGTHVERLTTTPGYDAEGTVCSKDGSIVFTSVRDGDIDLYRMDKDGKNVKRLTNTPGYDGGAFFNRDCTKIVWRASRPKPGPELDEFRALLKKGLVRPTKLEIYVANADGSDPVQLTYLDAASFAPFWHPAEDRILFSSNYGDPKGREFDIWSVHTDGTGLERVTSAPGFDGFPMFSPDGKWLAFSSNRATPPGQHDTNVFVARWVEDVAARASRGAAERILDDIKWLADPARQGRGVGTKGLAEAGAYLEKRFKELGLKPAGARGYRQPFPVVTSVKQKPSTQISVGGVKLPGAAFVPLGFSASGKVTAPLVLAGYGIASPDAGVDDYAGLDVKGKIVVVRRFVPEGGNLTTPEAQRRYGDLRYKAFVAKDHGARALLVVDAPARPAGAAADWKAPDEARLPALEPEGYGNAGLLVASLARAAGAPIVDKLAAGEKIDGEVSIALENQAEPAFNVIARLPAAAATRKPGTIVVGAHYDHLGLGGRYSLAPDRHEPHGGADDNASGTSAILEVARALAATHDLSRDVVFVAFSGEESGVLGSTWMTKHPPRGLDPKSIVAMVNLDMVGRMRDNRVTLLGGDSAPEWKEILESACQKARVECSLGGDGYGPSDSTPFYAAGVPVAFFFTGAHSDYHKPSDVAAKINAAGAAQIAEIVDDSVRALASRAAGLTYRATPAPAPRGDLRSFNASLGTVPDYAGPRDGKGVLLAGVRVGGAAEAAGMKRGDVLVKLGSHDVGSVEDLMYVLNASHPGETVTAIVLRDGKRLELEATFQESKRH